VEGFTDMPKMRRTRKRRNPLQEVWYPLGKRICEEVVIILFLLTLKITYFVAVIVLWFRKDKYDT
jgi:hypothetical protein